MRAVSMLMVSLFAFTAAQAQEQQVQRAPLPAWADRSALLAVPQDAGGAVFIRRQDLVVNLTGTGQAQYVGYRLKILQPAALQFGNITIAWKASAGAPIVHSIIVYRDGQPIDVLKKATFEILRREDQLEAARLDGMLTAIFRVPDLRVGDELEVDLTTFDSDVTLGKRAAGLLVLSSSPAPGRYHLGLRWDDDRKPTFKVTPDAVSALRKSEHMVDLNFDNPPTLSPPKDAPPRYRWQRVLEYSEFTDWQAVSRHFAPLYAKAMALAAGSPLKQEAGRIAAVHAGPAERAAAALKLVQQDVRYIYVGLNGGNLTPASADETWQRRYGDCKGKTALLLALLAELGVRAEAVLVNSSGGDDGFDLRLPIPALFDHVLVRAQIGTGTYWLDGTLPSVAGPSLTPIYPVKWILPLAIAGAPLEKVPPQVAVVPDEISLYEIDARDGFDKPAHITTTSIVRGIKGLQQQLQFSSLTPGQISEAFRQRATGEVWQEIDDVKWRYDPQARASILTISGTGVVDWEDEDGGAKSLALPGGGFSPPERRSRATDQDRTAPFYSAPEYACHVTTVRLPISTQSWQWSSKPSFDTLMFGRRYYRAWELRDGAIRMVRGSRVEQAEIAPRVAQRDNDRITSFDNSMGWITFDPAGSIDFVGKGETVPATYDFDWTASNVPCMPGRLLVGK